MRYGCTRLQPTYPDFSLAFDTCGAYCAGCAYLLPIERCPERPPCEGGYYSSDGQCVMEAGGAVCDTECVDGGEPPE